MPAELRNVVPYFAKLQLILNDGTIELPIENQDGGSRMGTFKLNSAIFSEIIGYNPLDPANPVYADQVDFPAKNAPNENRIIMSTVLNTAKTAGYDVVTLLDEAFNEIAEEFAATKDQPAGTQVMGPVVIYRPDAFFANLSWTQPKSVTIKVGVYSAKKVPVEGGAEGETTWGVDKLKSNRYIVFEDTMTKTNRANQVSQLQASYDLGAERLVAVNQAIALREANDDIPENFPYQDIAGMSMPQLNATKSDVENRLTSIQSSINELQSVVAGDLSKLIPAEGATPTALQTKVLDAVKGLCIAILLTLKASREDWAGIDVEAIMSQFSLPEV